VAGPKIWKDIHAVICRYVNIGARHRNHMLSSQRGSTVFSRRPIDEENEIKSDARKEGYIGDGC
jgi:septum formation topological specificity factor MinE